jgi:hypothetical protein
MYSKRAKLYFSVLITNLYVVRKQTGRQTIPERMIKGFKVLISPRMQFLIFKGFLKFRNLSSCKILLFILWYSPHSPHSAWIYTQVSQHLLLDQSPYSRLWRFCIFLWCTCVPQYMGIKLTRSRYVSYDWNSSCFAKNFLWHILRQSWGL